MIQDRFVTQIEHQAGLVAGNQLDEAGFRLFQSSYQLGRGRQPDATILSVSYDPGVPVVYSSFVLIVLGIAWYVQSQRRRLRPSARRTGGVSTVADSKGSPSASTDDRGLLTPEQNAQDSHLARVGSGFSRQAVRPMTRK